MRIRWTIVVLAAAMLASGCYYQQATSYADGTTSVPWFCNPTNANSVTGPGMGSVDWYAGITRGPLPPEVCTRVALQLDLAKAYAEQYPTLGDAYANGFANTFNRINGMGTHTGKQWLTPADLADPSFDRFDPVVPDSVIDDVFQPTRPEFLQYDGNGPGAVLVGMSYYVRTDDGQPPPGFEGDNDWWHHHPRLCLSRATAEVIGVNTTDTACNAAANNGINVHFDDYYMLHVWLVDDLELHNDVHAAFHPCIVSGGAIFDMGHPCHQDSSLTIPAGAVPPGAGSDADGPLPFFCPLGLLADPEAVPAP